MYPCHTYCLPPSRLRQWDIAMPLFSFYALLTPIGPPFSKIESTWHGRSLWTKAGFLAYTYFKQIAKRRVIDKDQTLMLAQSLMYSSFKLYRTICTGPVYKYWLLAKIQPTLTRACGTLYRLIRGQMERKDNFMSNSCLWVKEVNCSYQVERVFFIFYFFYFTHRWAGTMNHIIQKIYWKHEYAYRKTYKHFDNQLNTNGKHYTQIR